MKIAVCTMTYNENIALPIWLRYYSRIFGRENLYVIDHGSDDGSTENLRGLNHIRLPRTPFSDQKRSTFIADLCKNLLNFYDYFIYTDTDEILCADPVRFPNLKSYLEEVQPEFETTIGLNLFHSTTEEPEINLSRPILAQRKYVYFVPGECKSTVTRIPLNWGGGFHTCEHMPRFSNIYNFHIKQMDFNIAMDRLRFLREIPREGSFGAHQLWEDEQLVRVFDALNNRNRLNTFDFSKNLAEFSGGMERRQDGRYGLMKDFRMTSENPLRIIPKQFESVV